MSDTLVLNATFEPLAAVSWQRAVRMLTLGKVTVLEEYEDRWIHSVTFAIRMPAVVRLLTRVGWRHTRPKFCRANILLRDGYRCQYCGKRLAPERLTFDHVIPRSLGGTTRWGNIATACQACNRKKGGRTPQESGMAPLRPPAEPGALPAILFTITRHKAPEAWRSYLASALYWHVELQE